MNEAAPAAYESEPPGAAIARRRGISIVWLIPLVALLIGAFLAYKAYTSQGPMVTITFDTAEGLEAGRTKLRYLDVEVGTVQSVEIGPDLQHIVVSARLVPSASAFLRERTQFWIVKPRVGVGGVSGLGTLLSGAYIGIRPGDGDWAYSFVGLSEPPQLTTNVAGRQFVLQADTLGSVSRGAPIYYRGIEVGQVLGHDLIADASSVEVTIFVQKPYDDLVRTTSRFWNVSGVNLVTGASGVSLNVASVQSLLVGGIEFDNPPSTAPSEVAREGQTFALFESKSAVVQAQFTERIPFLVYFEGSVRGLNPGAPVEYRGMRVGVVTEVRLELDQATKRVRIPVLLALEPQRFVGATVITDEDRASHAIMRDLVRQGLRAQLQTGNFLTGELFVDLTMQPNAPPAELNTSGPVPIIPSVPNTLEALQASATEIMNKIASLPIDELVTSLNQTATGLQGIVNSPDLKETLRSIGPTLAQLQETMARLEGDSGPLLASLRNTADAATATLEAMRRTFGPSSNLAADSESLMQELTRAARSVRLFADYLDRHPEALIRGRTGVSGR